MPEIEEIKADIQEMFSADAVRWGDLVFVSGCVPVEPDGTLVGAGDIEAQTRKTLENLGRVLAAAGSDFEHVLKTTVFMTDIAKRHVTHEMRGAIFGSRPPVSTMVEITALGIDGAEIEIDAIAVVKDG